MGLESCAVRVAGNGLKSATLPAIAHCLVKDSLLHFVVLMHYTEQAVRIMDPADGKFAVLSNQEFEKQWTGILLMMEPKTSFRTLSRNTNVQRLFRLFRPHKRALIWSIVFAVMFSGLAISISFYIKYIVDEVLVGRDMQVLGGLSILMIALAAGQFIVGLAKSRLTLKTSQAVDKSLVLGYFDHVVKLPQQFFSTMQTGEIMSRVNDAVRINTFVNDIAINMIVDAFILVISLICMFAYKWQLALIVLSIIPVYAFLVYRGNRINRKWQRKLMEASAGVESLMVQSLTAISTVKKLGLENFSGSQLKIKYEELLSMMRSSSIGHMYVHSFADFSTRIFTVITLWIGCRYVFNQTLSEGELLAFFTLISYFTAPVLSLIGGNRNLREMTVACDRLFEIMELEPEQTSGIRVQGDVKTIEFRNVSFGYMPGEFVLRSVDLLIKANEITGIKGASGSGKSTLVMLLMKLYAPDKGRILIDEKDIQALDTQDLRSIIGCVPQESQLFKGTIRENIVVGERISENYLIEIAERSGVLDFCKEFPSGLDTLVAEQGVNLSGGQKQKICLARALYRRPRVLILDEPTAALDGISEQKLMQTIEWYKNPGNTVIIISHSDTALKICNNIVTLNHGQVTGINPPL